MIIYVGNFPADTGEQDLLDRFGQYGQVTSITMMRDEISERVLGFGFVEMPDATAGHKAIAELNRATLKGATLIVCETAPRIERRRFAHKQASPVQVPAANHG